VEVEPVETGLDFGNKPVSVFDNFSTTSYSCMGWVSFTVLPKGVYTWFYYGPSALKNQIQDRNTEKFM